MKLVHAFFCVFLFPLITFAAGDVNRVIDANPPPTPPLVKGGTVVPLVKGEKIVSYKLNNGLTLLVKEDHRSPAVVNMVWYRVGSAYESSGTTGISHALEHMMFQGTPKYPAGKFSEIIAENGGEENAFTSQDYTAYFEKLDHSLLPLAFQLESDRMQNLSLKDANFTKEIQVVREERRMRIDDNPTALTYERFMAAAYLSTPYHNPTIGWPDDLSQLNIDDLRRWYHTWYAPNNATIVVVGDVQANQVYQLALRYFGKISSKPLPAFKHHSEPPALGERHVIVKKSATQPVLFMGYIAPSRATEPSSWKPYALTLLSAILSSGNSSRLDRHLVREEQVASQVDADYDMVSLYETPFMLYAIPSKKHTLSDVKTALLKEINALQKIKVTEKELEKIKNQFIAQKIYARDSIFQQANDIGAMVSIGLPLTAVDTDIEQLKAITPEQIQQVAQEYLKQDQMTVAVLIPQAFKPGEKAQINAFQQGGAIR